MSTKPKRVVINDIIDENTDYLVPLQDFSNRSQVIKPSTEPSPTGVFSSIFLPITLLLYAGVPISQFVIGLIYINQCTVRQFISTYMILSGLCGIAFVIVGLLIFRDLTQPTTTTKTTLPYDNKSTHSRKVKILIPIFIILLLSVIGWFFAGQFIVFEVKLRVEFFDPVLPEYCHGNLYKAAYILIFVDYLIFLIGIILNVLGRSAPAEQPPTRNSKRPTSK